jgi:hypothetical protein
MGLAERLERGFSANAVTWFLRVFGLALIVDVATELSAGVWYVHTGRLYPWRHLGIVPLYPASVLAVEWTLRALAGLALLFGARRAKVVARALRVAAAVLFVAVLERYSNHGVLLFLIALFVTIAPPEVSTPDFERASHPALGLVRAQLVIVYAFSALNKLTHGFGSGDSLAHLANVAGLAGSNTRALSWAVIACELALPLLLMRAPRVGLAAVTALHVVFALLVPGVASFGLAMIAMAILFSKPARSSPQAAISSGIKSTLPLALRSWM